MPINYNQFPLLLDAEQTTFTNLGADEVFVGEPTNWFLQGTQGAAIRIMSDQSGTLVVESSETAQGPWLNEATVNYTAGELYVRTFFFTGSFFRVTYTNGPTPTTSFALGTALIGTVDVIQPRRRLAETVDTNEFTATTRSVLSCELRDAPGEVGIIQCGDGGTILTHEVGASSFETGITTATATATNLVPSAITNRQTVRFTIPSGSSTDVYIGPDNTVTTGNGFFMEKGNTYQFDLGPASTIWGITASGSATVTWLQY